MGALPQCWNSCGENFCQIKFIQLRPTGFWCPNIAWLTNLARNLLSMLLRTQLSAHVNGNIHANHFDQSHPNIKTTTLIEKCLLCLAEMWFPGCVAGKPCSPNQRERCSWSRMPQPVQCQFCGLQPILLELDGLPDSRGHPHEGIKNRCGHRTPCGCPHQWNIHTGPPLTSQPPVESPNTSRTFSNLETLFSAIPGCVGVDLVLGRSENRLPWLRWWVLHCALSS